MQFTVREIHHDQIVVDFEDGSWAQVPFDESMRGNKEQIVSAILEYAPKPVVTWVSDIPFQVGEVITSDFVPTVGVEEDHSQGAMGYKEMRESLYPDMKDQLDAYYWASQGVPEPLEEINAAITEVKRLIPKDIPPMTPEALSLYLLEQ